MRTKLVRGYTVPHSASKDLASLRTHLQLLPADTKRSCDQNYHTGTARKIASSAAIAAEQADVNQGEYCGFI